MKHLDKLAIVAACVVWLAAITLIGLSMAGIIIYWG
jgi:hypothetical protein